MKDENETVYPWNKNVRVGRTNLKVMPLFQRSLLRKENWVVADNNQVATRIVKVTKVEMESLAIKAFSLDHVYGVTGLRVRLERLYENND